MTKTPYQSKYTSDIPTMISLQEAAEKLGVSVSVIRNWVKDGTLRAFRVGPRLIRIRVSDLNGLLSIVGTPSKDIL